MAITVGVLKKKTPLFQDGREKLHLSQTFPSFQLFDMTWGRKKPTGSASLTDSQVSG